jgi:hypothetical protein
MRVHARGGDAELERDLLGRAPRRDRRGDRALPLGQAGELIATLDDPARQDVAGDHAEHDRNGTLAVHSRVSGRRLRAVL